MKFTIVNRTTTPVGPYTSNNIKVPKLGTCVVSEPFDSFALDRIFTFDCLRGFISITFGSNSYSGLDALNLLQRLIYTTSVGTAGSATPTYGILTGGTDVSGNFQAFKLDSQRGVLVAGETVVGSVSGIMVVQGAVSGNLPVVGNVGSGTTDSGFGVKVAALAVSGLSSYSHGQRVDAFADLSGRRYVTNVPLDGVKATYSAAVTFAPAAAATDVFTITGSATKTIRITEIRVTASQTVAASSFPISLIVRSAANTAGTSASVTAVPHDSLDAAATATVKSYTANPSGLGAAVGSVRVERMEATTSGGAAPPASTFIFGNKPSKAIVLRGTSQLLAVNFNANAAATAQVAIEWTEE